MQQLSQPQSSQPDFIYQFDTEVIGQTVNHLYYLGGICQQWQDIKKIVKRLQKFQKQFQQRQNLKLYFQLNHLKQQGCQYLSKIKWKKLIQIHLSGNQITDSACKILSKADWRQLEGLNLGNNKITSKGCQFLINGKWNKLQTLDLSSNNISDQGCLVLSKSKWSNFKGLNLAKCNITDKGCQILSKADWPNIQSLNLSGNKISDQGLYYISEAQWRNIKQLFLNSINITQQGSSYISNMFNKPTNRSKFRSKREAKLLALPEFYENKLIKLNLCNSSLNYQSCKMLAKINLNSLQQLGLANQQKTSSKNMIDAFCCLLLSKVRWKKLKYLCLSRNKIRNEGCRYLAKAEFNKLEYLTIDRNRISVGGWKQLAKMPMKKLSLYLNSLFEQPDYFSDKEWTYHTPYTSQSEEQHQIHLL